ncbi:MAG: phosphoglycerate kinase [Proteobacteria bacterium]|nr:phosphoglycerate kinase [Candidatus Enterousia scatequi]
MKLRTIDSSDLKGKFVLLRDDFNVQILDGKITDAFRIKQSMKTVNMLCDAGARVVICSHLGRPGGIIKPELSLRPVAEYMHINFIPDCLNRDFMDSMCDGDVVLLENLRFYPGEENNDKYFAEQLAQGFDLFVNDAFAVSHRASASTVGVTKLLPSFAGCLLRAEVENISSVMESATHPLLAIVGGSKVSTKIGVLKSLCQIADTVIVGGALGTTFLYACGYNVGNSLYEPDQKDNALKILDFADKHNCKFLLPVDKGVGQSFSRDAIRQNKTADSIMGSDVIIDDGIETTNRNITEIQKAKTVIWNGTFGMAEWGAPWDYSTNAIAQEIARQTQQNNLVSIVGGGDTVAALDAIGVAKDMTYVSTGGGAFLDFIEGRELPGISALKI